MTVVPHPRGAFPFARLDADIRERARVFEQAAMRTRRRADEEAIHDLRVSARRLNAALALWKGVLREKPRRTANRRIRKLRQSLGHAREVEVHLAHLKERIAAAPVVTRLAALPIVHRLEREVDRSATEAQSLAAPQRIERMVRGVERALQDMGPATQRSWNPLATAEETLVRRAREADAEIRHAIEGADDRALHDARIRIKKWRYTLECIRALRPDHPQKPKRLRDLQQALGDVHDKATLRDFLALEVRRLERKQMSEYAQVLRPMIGEIESERLAAVAEFRKIAEALELKGGLGSA